jgi:parvulin-like peptidyl-prolyl isomerase
MRIILVILMALISPLATKGADVDYINGILAIVNDSVITFRDVEASIAPSVALLTVQYERQPEVLQRKIMDLQRDRVEELVTRELILFDFTNSGYNLPETFIEDRLQERIKQDYYGDRAKLMKSLQDEGVTYERYRKNMRESIIVNALSEKHIAQELIISPFKIEQYYETNKSQYQMTDQVKLRAIEITKVKNSPKSAKLIAEEIIKKLDSGTPFAEMASVYSEAAQRNQGGDRGWIERSVLRKELEEVAFKLKSGERSGIVETAEACYILLVEDTKIAHVKPLTEVRDEIERTLLAAEQNRIRKQWIDRLKKKAFVRYF